MYRTGRPRLRTTRCLGWSGYSSLCKVGEFIKPSTPVAHRECSQPDVYCEFGKVRLEMLQGRVVVSLDHQIYRAPRACPVRSKVGIDVFCLLLFARATHNRGCLHLPLPAATTILRRRQGPGYPHFRPISQWRPCSIGSQCIGRFDGSRFGILSSFVRSLPLRVLFSMGQGHMDL